MTRPVQLKRKAVNNDFDWLLKVANRFYDRILRAMFMTLLFALDFIMFVYSINGRVIEDGQVNEALVYIIGGFFAVSLVIMFLLSISGIAQNFFIFVFVVLFTIIFLNQFALFNVDTFIETWLNEHAHFLSFLGFLPSSWLLGLVLGLVIFFSFKFSNVIIVTVIALLSSLTIGIYKTETTQFSKDEYVDIQSVNDITSKNQKNNLVYVMAPKFPSYHFLSTIKDINFRELRDFMIGFYAVNDFEIFPNAFVQKGDTVSNIVDIYNQVDYKSSSSGIRGYAEILNDWDFVHNSLDTMELEENKITESFSSEGYKVSTYSMPQFNLCRKNGAMVSDRCVVRQTHPVKLYDKNTTLEKNIYALVGEWILSFKMRDLKQLAKMFIDMSHLKGRKILSENRRLSIEGTSVLFDRIYQDYSKDGNGVVYMSFIELPSDLYVYDEFCNLKPEKQWVALKDNSLYYGGIDEKRKAYADQAKCLIGLLQMYMEEMHTNEKLANTDIIIQGVSPIRELAGMPADQYTSFVAEKLVSLGIRRGKNPKFLINTEICLASDFARSFITNEKTCYNIDNMKMTTEEAMNLKKNLINNSIIRGSRISNIAANYRDWYEEFRQKNSQYQAKLKQKLESQNQVHDVVSVEEQAPLSAPKVQTVEEAAPASQTAEPEVQPVSTQISLPLESSEMEQDLSVAEPEIVETETKDVQAQETVEEDKIEQSVTENSVQEVVVKEGEGQAVLENTVNENQLLETIAEEVVSEVSEELSVETLEAPNVVEGVVEISAVENSADIATPEIVAENNDTPIVDEKAETTESLLLDVSDVLPVIEEPQVAVENAE